jgi:site-specific DNA-cytosine methylase
MQAAGIRHLWGIEYSADIAAVAQLNGFNTIVANILDCNPLNFERPDFLHASPPCPNFSTANASGEETETDIALAAKVAEFITVQLPDYFTLENVFGYRLSKSWEIIARALLTAGYSLNYWHICTADWGVPQTRRRMIVIARRDGIRPMLPAATHAERPEVGLFGTLKKWVGWYEAIEDLIPGLPESKFADWQLKRLPSELRTALYTNGQYNGEIPIALKNQPANAITANSNQSSLKALIIDGRNSNQEWGKLYRDGEQPAAAVTVLERPAHYPRAFIVDGKLSTSGNEKKLQILDGKTPHATVVSSQSAMKDSKAYTSGRIVQMTTRALARFQSFPDDYKLSGKRTLDCRGIGPALIHAAAF